MTEGPIILEVPDLVGERFRLRPWQADDAEALCRGWHDPVVVAGSTPPNDRTVAGATRWIAGVDERRRAGLAFDLVIVDDADAVMGEVGLSSFDRRRRAALIGWWLHEDARGQGIAGAAVSLVVEWALGTGRLHALMAEIDPTNPASVRVAERAGFTAVPNPPTESQRAWYVARA